MAIARGDTPFEKSQTHFSVQETHLPVGLPQAIVPPLGIEMRP
jgi:hypothetical protein